MARLDLIHRTSVRRVAPGTWRVSYMLPYSGPLEAHFETWALAYAEACKIEDYRPWA